MDIEYARGQMLTVKLIDNKLFIGKCEKCTSNRLDLCSVRELPNGLEQNGVLSFYKREIASISQHVSDNQEQNDTSSVESNHDGPSTSKKNVIAMRKDEFERLEYMTTHYVYIETVNDDYFEAVDALSNCENIAVAVIGNNMKTIRVTGLLLMSSWHQVYIFDLHILCKSLFPTELKRIMVCEETRKVIHDSRLLVNYFWQRFQFKPNNIFDTYVADLVIQKDQTNSVPEETRSLSECLSTYLHFPDTFLESTLEITAAEWKCRPLPQFLKIQASRLITYLISLKSIQLEIMLKEFDENVYMFSHSLLDVGSYMSHLHLHSGNIIPEEIEKIFQNIKLK